MADIPFRTVGKESKSNLTTRVKAIDYDSRYYLNDHDAPIEDTYDYSGTGNPGDFTEPCV